MKKSEKHRTFNVHAADDLKKAIAENPDLPLVVLAGCEANTGDYSYMFCTSVSVEVGEILDCQQEINDEICFTDRDDFREAIEEMLDGFTGSEDHPEDWFKKEADRIEAEYEQYWRKCILLTVDN